MASIRDDIPEAPQRFCRCSRKPHQARLPTRLACWRLLRHARIDAPGPRRPWVPVDFRTQPPTASRRFALLTEASRGCVALDRGRRRHVMFSRPSSSALSANGTTRRPADTGARAYRLHGLQAASVIPRGLTARNTYFDGKQITRGRPGVPLLRQADGPADGCDVCYTNHAEAIRTTWMPCSRCSPGRRQLRHGRAGRRRHHVGLSEHVIS